MPSIYCHLHTINWKYIKKDFNDYSVMSTELSVLLSDKRAKEIIKCPVVSR
jgi:hypothetical protein